ncbi:MAG: hypothetical protein HKN28_12455 [Alphaproteobacteria bacterium]|nr:hypothetical protein [Alphaproteobacteria bacterium]
MLRYFASTLEDPEARIWAEKEVRRLDELTALKAEVRRKQIDIEEKEAELRALEIESDQAQQLRSEIIALEKELIQKDSQVNELKEKAGLEFDKTRNPIFHIRFNVDWDSVVDNVVTIRSGESLFPLAVCTQNDGIICQTYGTGNPPSRIILQGLSEAPKIEVSAISDTRDRGAIKFRKLGVERSTKTLDELSPDLRRALQAFAASEFIGAPLKIYNLLKYRCSKSSRELIPKPIIACQILTASNSPADQ